MIIKMHNQIFSEFDSGLDNWKGLYERWIVYISVEEWAGLKRMERNLRWLENKVRHKHRKSKAGAIQITILSLKKGSRSKTDCDQARA